MAVATSSTVCAGSTDSLKVTVSSTQPATYTAPPSVSNPTTDEDLGDVTIMQGTTIILNNSSSINSLVGTVGTASGTAGSYSNFTAFGPYSIDAGQTYSFSLSSLQSTTAFSNSIAIYIDFNRNGVFTDANEKVYAAAATTSGAHTETGTFTVPATAFNGLTRMRVMSNEGLITSPTQSLSYGEYEEYVLNINSTNNGGGNIPAITYSWSDGTSTVATGNPAAVNPQVNTTYTATLSVSGCTLTTNPVTVTVTPLPSGPAYRSINTVWYSYSNCFCNWFQYW